MLRRTGAGGSRLQPGQRRAEGDSAFSGRSGARAKSCKSLVSDFERENPGLRLVVQQIPWTSAHEKLLTAFVGKSTPDLAQLGNTWIPELAAIGALERLDDRVAGSAAVAPAAYFPGSVADEPLRRRPLRRPVVRGHAGPLLPPRPARAGRLSGRRRASWEKWREAMRKIKSLQDPAAHPILLPTNEWEQATILGLQEGSRLLSDNGTRGAFREAAVRRGGELLRGPLP